MREMQRRNITKQPEHAYWRALHSASEKPLMPRETALAHDTAACGRQMRANFDDMTPH
jgi:hypothetical protein